MNVQSQPLVLVTRPAPQAATLAQAIETAYPGKWRVVISPLMEIQTFSVPIDLSDIHTLIFTSANGVRSFVSASSRRDIPALCAGQSSCDLAQESGLAARNIAQDAAGLIEALQSRPNPPGSNKFLHLHGQHQTSDIVSTLQAGGIPARGQSLYDQIAVPLPEDVISMLQSGEIDTVTLFSPRTAQVFAQQISHLKLDENTRLLCLSNAIAAQVAQLNLSTHVATRPDQSALLKIL